MRKKGMEMSMLGWTILALALAVALLLIISYGKDAIYNIWSFIADIFRFGG